MHFGRSVNCNKMSSITSGSVCPSWTFAWTVEIPYCQEGIERRSNPFSFKGHDVHLRLHSYFDDYSMEVCAPPSFPSLSEHDMIVRVETKNKTPLDLPIIVSLMGVIPENKNLFWQYYEHEILEAYPDFRDEGGILTFLVFNVDPPKGNQAEEFVQKTEQHFKGVSSLEKLSSDLSSLLLRDQDSGPDVELLLCGGGEDRHSIKVHKNIVCARSKVISTMLKSDMSEGRTGRIEIKDMDREVFDHFVHYLYTGILPDLNEDSARGLYEAGDRYQVPSLMRRCATFLRDNVTPKNGCELLVLADAHGDRDFKEYAMDYIVENKIPLQEDHWLPFHDTYPKLSSEVLYRFCKWLNK